MAKVVSYLLSLISQNVADATGGTIQQLTGPVIVLRPKYIPSEYSFSLTLGINDIEKKTDNRLRITIYSPSGRLVIDTGYIDLPELIEDPLLPDKYQGFSLTLPVLNAALDQEGVYHFKLYFNDDGLIFDKEIPVYLQKEAQNGLRDNDNI